MSRRLFFVGALLTVAIVLFGGCRSAAEPDYNRELPPGELALVRVADPNLIPDFTGAAHDVAYLKEGISNSLHYLSKPSSKEFFPYGPITHDHAVASLERFAELLDKGLRGSELNQAIRDEFDVYMSVGWDNKGTVLFTGYYTPIFDGSLERTEKYRFPLYAEPNDLVRTSKGEIRGRRLDSGQIVEYPSRQEIQDSEMLEGTELVWLGNGFEAYIAHVQGSAQIRLPDGELVSVGYAGNNGHEYDSVGQRMVEKGHIEESQLSLAAMIDFFEQNPDMVDQYTSYNPRFVFFRRSQGPPRGSLNEPVIPYRTIATDKSVYPRASLTYFETTLPRLVGERIYQDPYNGFALDQDTGGAIRAPGRCDVYMGIGQEAGKIAGQTYKEGRLYYLFLKK